MARYESKFAPGDFVVRSYSKEPIPPDEQELQVISVIFDESYIVTYNCENIRTGARQFYTENMLTKG